MKNRFRRTAVILFRVGTIFLCITALLIGGFLLGCRILGYRAYRIDSPSMSPVIDEGDLIYIESVDPQELTQGDIIAFTMPDSNAVVTHRISRVDFDSRTVVTIGDQNREEDADSVPFDRIIGRYVFRIRRITF